MELIGYGLNNLGVEYQQGQKIFLFPEVKTVCGTHPPSYAVRNGVVQGSKWPRHEADQTSTPRAEVKS